MEKVILQHPFHISVDDDAEDVLSRISVSCDRDTSGRLIIDADDVDRAMDELEEADIEVETLESGNDFSCYSC